MRRFDASIWFLIFSNLFTIVLAIAEHWTLGTVLYIYWWQNIIIGFFAVLKMLSLNGYYFKKGSRTVHINKDTAASEGINAVIVGKCFLAGFFTLHYGLFNFGYLSFLRGLAVSPNIKFIFLTTALFFINHLFSFAYNYKNNIEEKNISKIMFFPYQRIFPMHLTIMFGILVMIILRNQLAHYIVLVFFLLLKTVADVKMHLIEHAEKAAPPAAFN